MDIHFTARRHAKRNDLWYGNYVCSSAVVGGEVAKHIIKLPLTSYSSIVLVFLLRDVMHKRGLCCLSVCPSVRHVRGSRQNEWTYLQNFFTIGSDTILVFPYQKGVPIFRREPPNGDVEARGYEKSRFSTIIFTNISLYLRNDYSQMSFHPYNI